MKAKTGHGYHHPAQDSFRSMPIVPFPELSYIVPTDEHATSKHKTKTPSQSLQSQRVESKSIALKKGSPCASSPIPFPEDHIQKTPSELQIDRNKIQAEYDIVQMKARIAVAKQLRAQIHPRRFLSSKDLPGRLRRARRKHRWRTSNSHHEDLVLGGNLWLTSASIVAQRSEKAQEGPS